MCVDVCAYVCVHACVLVEDQDGLKCWQHMGEVTKHCMCMAMYCMVPSDTITV